MARARSIKPSLFDNEMLGMADPLYTILFEGLWCHADREGRLEDRPLRIKAQIFPYRDGIKPDDLLNWLEENQFIIRYSVNNIRYIQIVNFTKHQKPHKQEPASIIPPMPEDYKKDIDNNRLIDFGSSSEEHQRKVDVVQAWSVQPIRDDVKVLHPDCTWHETDREWPYQTK